MRNIFAAHGGMRADPPPTTARKLLAFARRLARARGGAISVEFAFVIPVLLILAGGAFDLGRLGMRFAEAQSAARAGVQFATQNQANVNDPEGIVAAALADARSATLTAEAQAPYCACPTTTVQACNLPCPDGGYAQMYIAVTARDTVDLLLPYPSISPVQTVVAISEGRVR